MSPAPMTTTMSDEARFAPAPNVVAETVDGELMLLDMAGNACFGLNDVGALAWSAISSGKTLRETAEAISASFEVDEVSALGDLRELVRALLDRSLLRAR